MSVPAPSPTTAVSGGTAPGASTRIKKRKTTSAICGRDLFTVYETLQRAKETVASLSKTPEVEDGAQDDQQDLVPSDTMIEKINEVLKMLEPKVHSRPVYTLSSINYDALLDLNVREGKAMKLKIDPDRLAAQSGLAAHDMWSHEAFHRHLCRLEGSVAQTEAGARTRIDAFFFRSMAMLSPSLEQESKGMVMGLELPITASINKACLRGFIDYIIYSGRKQQTAAFLRRASLAGVSQEADKGIALVVAEARKVGVPLGRMGPQAVGEMYACAGVTGSKIIRGALTDGHSWIFILLKVDEDKQGATYHLSAQIPTVSRSPQFALEVDREACGLVVAILAHWIQRSFEELENSDWFEWDKEA